MKPQGQSGILRLMELNCHLEFISLHFLYTLKEAQVMSKKLCRTG